MSDYISVPHKNIGDMLSHEEFNEVLDAVQGKGNETAIESYAIHVKNASGQITPAPAAGNVVVDGTTKTTDLLVTGAANVQGAATVGSLTSEGAAVFRSTTMTNGIATFKKNVRVEGGVNVTGKLAPDGAGLQVTNDAKIQGALSVKKDSKFEQNLSVGTVANAHALTVTGSANIAADLEVGGTTNLIGDVTAGKGLTVGGTATISKGLTVGTTTINPDTGADPSKISTGELSVTGTTSTDTLKVTGIARARRLVVEETMGTVPDASVSDGSGVVENDLRVGKTLTVEGPDKSVVAAGDVQGKTLTFTDALRLGALNPVFSVTEEEEPSGSPFTGDHLVAKLTRTAPTTRPPLIDIDGNVKAAKGVYAGVDIPDHDTAGLVKCITIDCSNLTVTGETKVKNTTVDGKLTVQGELDATSLGTNIKGAIANSIDAAEIDTTKVKKLGLTAGVTKEPLEFATTGITAGEATSYYLKTASAWTSIDSGSLEVILKDIYEKLQALQSIAHKHQPTDLGDIP